MNDTGGPSAPAPARMPDTPAAGPHALASAGPDAASASAGPDTAPAPEAPAATALDTVPAPEAPAAGPAPVPEAPASAGPDAVPAPIPYLDARTLRRAALWAGLLFLPATLLGLVLALSSEAGGVCVMRGTCREIPGWLYATTLAVAGGAWLRALTVPDGAPPTRARWAALWTLIGAEMIFICLVMGYFLP
ncbi:hypothetical protein [Streptomyces sp. NPDC085466]|uniref:hypothetical protein n=1 Tax=Streptomyces sp. NPDC085466 TaxID=3365725 RepID=UPI0037CEEA7E